MTRKALLAAACLCALTATAAAALQRNPTAHCNDGTYYYGARGRLACAHHRGVSEWLARPQAVRPLRHPATAGRGPHDRRPATPHATARKRPSHPRPSGAVATTAGRHHAGGAKDAGVVERAPAGATAHCRDGTWSKDPRRTGACARHGGIANWLGRR